MESLSRHDQKIKEYVETDETRQWMHRRFRKPMRNFSLRGFLDFLCRGEDAHEVTFVPDAWDIDFANRTVHLLEVVDQNQINSAKLQQLYRLFWILDAEGFGLAMIVHDMTLGVTLAVTSEQMQVWALQMGKGEPWKAQVELQPA